MILFQEKIASYVMWEYEKGRDIVPLIKKIEEVNITKWKPTTPTAPTGSTVPAAKMLSINFSTMSTLRGRINSRIIKVACIC